MLSAAAYAIVRAVARWLTCKGRDKMTLNDIFMAVGVTLGGAASFMLALSVLLTVLQQKGR
jgi:hypothetical protein